MVAMDRSVIVGPEISLVEKEVTVCAGAKTVEPLIVVIWVTVGPVIWTDLVETIVEAGRTLVEMIVEAGMTCVETETGKVFVETNVEAGRNLVEVIVDAGRT
jgi:hypothetical protein